MQAAEGFWEENSASPAPYNWIIIPDQTNQRNRFTLATPVLGSLWLTHSLRGRVAGLKNTPRDLQPTMGMVFYGFHAMFTLAILMFFIVAVSLWLRVQKRLFSTRWFLRALVIMTPSGFIATIAGWYTAETGRQPWVIWGILRTADAISPVPGGAMLSTLIAFVMFAAQQIPGAHSCDKKRARDVVIYALFITAFLIFTFRMIRRGPEDAPDHAEASGSLVNALRTQVMDHAAAAHPGEGR
jgi:cytochrome d ubiquinol oxidase subunit I